MTARLSKTRTLILPLLLLFVTTIINVHGQEKKLKFENYSKDHDLLHSYVLDVFQDSEGFIWVGSYGGLNKFDGTNFTSYNNLSVKKLPTNTIHEIYEPTDSDGKTIWLGTDNGLVKLYKPTMTFTHYPYNSTGVLAIMEDQNGMFWLGTERNGVLKFDPTNNEYKTCSLSKTFDDKWGKRIETIVKDKVGNFWIGGENTGVIKFTPSNDTFERYSLNNDTLADQSINCIYKYYNKYIVGTSKKGLFLFDEKTNTCSKLANNSDASAPIFPAISGISQDHEGDLWVATLGGGLYEVHIREASSKMAVTAVEQYTKNSCGASSLSNNLIQVMYRDQTGNLWMGTLGGGLSKLDFYSHKFDHYEIQESIDGNLDGRSVVSVGKTKNGNIWYGTQSDGVYIYTPKLKKAGHIRLKTPNNENSVVRQIYCDYHNNMWLTVDGGMFLISPDGLKQKYFDLSKHGLQYANIHAIAIDIKDHLWFGVYGHGVYKIALPRDPFTLDELDLSDHYWDEYSKGNLSSNNVWAIHIDADDQIWVGTDKGLDIYETRRNSFIQVLDKNVSSITESKRVKNSSIWVGTYGNGVYLMNKSDFSHINYSTQNGLSSNNINGILEDENGNIWLGTEKGLCSIEPQGLYNIDLNSLSEEKINKHRTHCYYLQDGLQGHEFHLNANEQLIDGRLLFGGPKGFNIFNPQHIIENTYVFPAKITDIKIQNVSIQNDTTLTKIPEYIDSINLAYKQNYFTIEFTQVCLSNPDYATYQYKLEGYDNDWITTEANHTRITYTGIPEGDYTMKIKTINPDGFPSDKITQLAIHIDPPWYRTLWFRVLSFILIAIVSLTAYRIFSARNKLKHEADLTQQQDAFEKEKLKADLDYKNREISASAMYLLNRNEKLIEIKDLVDTSIRKATGSTTELKKIIDKIENVLKDKDNWESFEKNFNLIDTNFTKRLMEVYPTLSNNDIKICTYMRMNLASKEIAGLLNIAPKSLETSRLRIRKKMGLESSIYLSDFILKF